MSVNRDAPFSPGGPIRFSAGKPPSVASSRYGYWTALELTNGLVTLHVTPQLGGRIIQACLGDFEYFWTDPRQTKLPTVLGVKLDGSFTNYGGSRVWPAPQGWSGEHEFPFPPVPFFGEGPNRITEQSCCSTSAFVEMKGKPDPYTGIFFTRSARLVRDSACVQVQIIMTNADAKPRRWGIWQIVQHDARNRDGEGFNEQLRGYCRVNRASRLAKAARPMFGMARHPSLRVVEKTGLAVIEYHHAVGKIAVDSNAGWLAVVNAQTGHVFVEQFQTYPERPYPDDASVEFYINGPGALDLAGEHLDITTDPESPAYFMESEVFGPFADLAPGESQTFQTRWCMARIPKGCGVYDVNESGVVCQRPKVFMRDNRLAIAGAFGVFRRGRLLLTELSENGERLATTSLNRGVSPMEPLEFHGGEFLTPVLNPATARAAIELQDLSGDAVAQLAELNVNGD